MVGYAVMIFGQPSFLFSTQYLSMLHRVRAWYGLLDLLSTCRNRLTIRNAHAELLDRIRSSSLRSCNRARRLFLLAQSKITSTPDIISYPHRFWGFGPSMHLSFSHTAAGIACKVASCREAPEAHKTICSTVKTGAGASTRLDSGTEMVPTIGIAR